MKIGTVRKEEACVEDSRAGYHPFVNEDQEEYGSFEVLWIEETVDDYDGNLSLDALQPGWYWQTGFPGCIPDGPPNGPFSSSIQAYYDAIEL